MALALFAHQAGAQSIDSTTNSNATPRWIVICDNTADAKTLACSMRMRLFQPNSAIQTMAATIFRNAAGVKTMRLQLPHGLDVSKGASISIDNSESVRHPIRTADANDAYASILLSDALTAAMKSGDVLKAGVEAANGNSVSLQMSLLGFSDALALMAH